MNQQLDKKLKLAKKASLQIAKLNSEKKKNLFIAIAENIKKYKKEIFSANELDVIQAKEAGKAKAFIDRLTFSEKEFFGMIVQLKTIANLKDVIGEVIQDRILANGVCLKKIRFPIGVIAVIYESRPNVTIDAAALCLKSGNAVVLKGGSEAIHTNRILIQCIYKALEKFSIAKEAVMFMDNADHKIIEEMLTRNYLIDVVIPRGGYKLTQKVAQKSLIPILYHASGGARMYVDKSANIEQALKICINSKTNRTGVCNALDAVLVHKKIAENFLTRLDILLENKGFEVRADIKAKEYMKHAKKAKKEDFSTEFLDSILAVKVVANAKEALAFIKSYTHGHTEVLAAEDQKIISAFVQEIDASVLMINCSSRLNDGKEFGMGAEIGIATGKLHARGPVGIQELTTYKWIAYGKGQIKQ